MSKNTKMYIGIGAAAFVGVLGALQVNRMINPPAPQAMPIKIGNEAGILPAQLPSGTRAPDFREAAARVNQSVVSIDKVERFTDFSRENVFEQSTGTGSGVVISGNGTIVTNNHVVQGADEVRVRTSDGKTFTARVVGTDPISDLAVLKVDTRLTPIPIGKSTDVRVGQWVMAVGNPLGFDNTVSVGVVSSLKRNLPVGENGLVDAIQTDASINPGNSGGALTDANGNLIGINSAIASRTGQSIGIGFAVPVDRMNRVVDDILKFGYARYAGLGLTYRPDFSQYLAYPDFRSQLAERLGAQNVPSQGLFVAEVRGRNVGGIQPNDILLKINNQPVNNTFELNKILVPKRPGDRVTVTYWSRGETKTAQVTLAEVRRDQPSR